MFESILTTTTETSLSMSSSLIVIVVALILGLVISAVYMLGNKEKPSSSSFAITLVILPPIVAIIIMLVGSDVAKAFSIAGVFSLVRFRSAPGDAKDITSVFFAMAAGLAAGMGFITYAIVITVIIAVVYYILCVSNFGQKKVTEKQLKIVIPEDLNYEGTFDDLFEEYTNKWTLEKVKTTNLGTLFELNYKIQMKDGVKEKEFIDSLRCRNGNLNIMLGLVQNNSLAL